MRASAACVNSTLEVLPARSSAATRAIGGMEFTKTYPSVLSNCFYWFVVATLVADPAVMTTEVVTTDSAIDR